MPQSLRHLHRFLSPLIVSILIACLALFLFERLADEMREGDTLHFDSAIRNCIHAFSSPPLTAFMRALTNIGNVGTVITATAAVSLALWFKQRAWDAAFLTISIAGGGLLMWVLKILFHRQRPAPYFGITVPGDYSFPSGHALVAVCFYGTLAAILVTHQSRRGVRVAIWIFAMLMMIGIGVSRIYLGVHYPSDVLAGYLAATFWVLAVSIMHRRKLDLVGVHGIEPRPSACKADAGVKLDER